MNSSNGALMMEPESPNVIRVRLVKKMAHGLGLYIRQESGAATISGLVPGSDAEQSQLIYPGDRIVGINGMDVTRMPFLDILTSLGQISIGNFVILSLETVNRMSRLVIVMGEDDVPHIKQLRDVSGDGKYVMKNNRNGGGNYGGNSEQMYNYFDTEKQATLRRNSKAALNLNSNGHRNKAASPPITRDQNQNGQRSNRYSDDSAMDEDRHSPPPRPKMPLPKPRRPRDDSLERNSKSSSSHGYASDDGPKPKNNKRPVDVSQDAQQSAEPSAKKPVKLINLLDGNVTQDTLHLKANRPTNCTHSMCTGSMMRIDKPENSRTRPPEEVLDQAKDFLNQYYESLKKLNSSAHQDRWREVESSIKRTGSYKHTYEELMFGCKTAWRNSQRCIGRISWSKLYIIDGRDAKTPRDMYEKLVEHMKYAANEGNLRSAITLFPQREGSFESDFRIWNAQLVRYAGYKQPDGSILGDPANVEFTEVCLKLGWKPRRTRYDLLPWVLGANGGLPELFEIPKEYACEVDIDHPKYPNVKKLGLRWYGLPAVSAMLFDCGGVLFPAAAFNGWYLSTEISRDLCDANRYNAIEEIADAIGLDTRNITSLWKDQAYLECNRAVLYSFQKAKVTVVDQHTVAESFMQHMENEQRLRGGCPADWVWIAPPLGGSLLPVFHQEMIDYRLAPCYDYQVEAWKVHDIDKLMQKAKSRGGEASSKLSSSRRDASPDSSSDAESLPDRSNAMVPKSFGGGRGTPRQQDNTPVLILYATETGKSAKFSKNLSEIFKSTFDVNVFRMDEYDMSKLDKESLILMIASTAGNGDPPESGADFAKYLNQLTSSKGSSFERNSAARFSRRRSSIAGYQQRKRINSIVNGYRVKNPDQDEMSTIRGSVDGPFNSKKYAVFGLGSSAYKHFCAFAFQLDETFRQLGADPLMPVETGDELNAQDKAFKKWAAEVYKAACQVRGVTGQDTTGEKGQEFLDGSSDWKKGNYRVSKLSGKGQTDLGAELARIHNKKLQTLTLVERTNLQSSKSPRKTLQLTLEGRSALGYQPGDHLAIFPKNDEKMLSYLFQRLGTDFKSSSSVQLEMMDSGSQSWKPVDRIPTMSLKALFSSFLDVMTPPSQNLLGKLAKSATDLTDQRRLASLSQDEKEYEKWKLMKWPSLLDTLEEFPSVDADISLLLAELPILQPRFYSVSSSPLVNPKQVTATIAVFASRDGMGETHSGVCSSYVGVVPVGEPLHCFFRSAPYFHLPPKLSTPIYMICAGTGIAPFRGFWQHFESLRTNEEMPKFEAHLIFGCRNSKMDHVYKNEIANLLQDGILKSFHLALSQEPGNPKTYVQQLIVTLGKKLVKDIRSRDAHIYVCGEVSMATSVWDAIEDLCIAAGGMGEDQAEDLMNSMRASNRYHEDIFGTYYHLSSR